MYIFEILNEAENKTAVFTFGRFNPPTKGHEKLINRLHDLALGVGSEAFVFTGQTHDKNKNPLTYDKKINFLQQFFPETNIVDDKSIKGVFDALGYLESNGFKKVYMVVGEDRVSEFRDMITPYISSYNPNVDPDKALNFQEFDVISAGHRDPDADGIEGISGSKARELASSGEEEDFIKYAAPSTKNTMLKRSLYNEVRKGMGILGNN